MDDLIISRTQLAHQSVTWLVAADNRGLDLHDCGCGRKVETRIVSNSAYASKEHPVVDVTFFHPEHEYCRLAFGDKDFNPLTYKEYCGLLGLEYEEDQP